MTATVAVTGVALRRSGARGPRAFRYVLDGAGHASGPRASSSTASPGRHRLLVALAARPRSHGGRDVHRRGSAANPPGHLDDVDGAVGYVDRDGDTPPPRPPDDAPRPLRRRRPHRPRPGASHRGRTPATPMPITTVAPATGTGTSDARGSVPAVAAATAARIGRGGGRGDGGGLVVEDPPSERELPPERYARQLRSPADRAGPGPPWSLVVTLVVVVDVADRAPSELTTAPLPSSRRRSWDRDAVVEPPSDPPPEPPSDPLLVARFEPPGGATVRPPFGPPPDRRPDPPPEVA